jgi:hypothetical protein
MRKIRLWGFAILIALMAILLTFFPTHQPLKVSGPYPIGTAHFTFTDDQRLESYSRTMERRQVELVC